MRSQRVRHDWVTNTHYKTHTQTQWHILMLLSLSFQSNYYRKLFLYLVVVIYIFYIFLLAKFSLTSIIQLCPTVCSPMDCSTPGFPIHEQFQSLLKFMSIQLWCHPTISSSVVPFSCCLRSLPASGSFQMSQLFPSGGQSIRSFNISPSSEYSGLNSFRMDWLDLLAVQGTLKSLLQHHSSKASILRHSAFFIVQLSHPDMTTGKTIALTRQTFVDKVMSLLFNMLSRLVVTFLPRSVF